MGEFQNMKLPHSMFDSPRLGIVNIYTAHVLLLDAVGGFYGTGKLKFVNALI